MAWTRTGRGGGGEGGLVLGLSRRNQGQEMGSEEQEKIRENDCSISGVVLGPPVEEEGRGCYGSFGVSLSVKAWRGP